MRLMKRTLTAILATSIFMLATPGCGDDSAGSDDAATPACCGPTRAAPWPPWIRSTGK